MAQLADLDLDGVEELRRLIATASNGASTMTEAAARITGMLVDGLLTPTGERACSTVRLFKTHRLGQLPPEYQELAHAVAPEASDATLCLVLIGADGGQRLPYEGLAEETVLPFAAHVLDEVPIMPRLLAELGVDLRSALDPRAALAIRLHQKSFNVYLERDLAANEDLLPNPAHRDLIRRLGTRTLIAAGGALPSGELLVLTVQATEDVDEGVGDLFRLLAISIKATLIPFTYRVFGPEG